MLDVALALPFQVYLWRVQNLSFAHLVNRASGANGSSDPCRRASADQEWGRELSAVQQQLHIRGTQ
jgi:hypothetical protein